MYISHSNNRGQSNNLTQRLSNSGGGDTVQFGSIKGLPDCCNQGRTQEFVYGAYIFFQGG